MSEGLLDVKRADGEPYINRDDYSISVHDDYDQEAAIGHEDEHDELPTAIDASYHPDLANFSEFDAFNVAYAYGYDGMNPYGDDDTALPQNFETPGPLLGKKGKKSQWPLPQPKKRGPPPKPPLPPGPRKYFVLLGAFCALFASFGWRSGSGIFQSFYEQDMLRQYSSSTIAWINSLGFFLMYCGAILVNPLSNKYGPRVIMFAGSTLHVGGLIATSFCTDFWQILLAQGIVSSLGASALFFTSVTMMGNWFPRRQVLTIAISANGTSLGGILFPLAIKALLPEVLFPWTMRIMAAIIAVLAAIANVCLKYPPNFRGPPKGRKRPPFWLGLNEKKVVMTIIAISVFANGYFLTLIFVASVASVRGWQDAILSIVIMNASSFFGRMIPGLFADRVGKFNSMIMISVFCWALVFALWIPGASVDAEIAFSVLFGFFAGSTISLGPTLMFQVADLSRMGIYMSKLYLVQGIAALVVAPVGGALLDANGGEPLYLQLMAGAMSLLGTLLLIAARVDQVGWSLKARY